MSSINLNQKELILKLTNDLRQTSPKCWENLLDLDRKIIETALQNWKIGAELPQFQRAVPEQFPYGRRITGFSNRLYIHLNKSAIDGIAGKGNTFKVKRAFLLQFNEQEQLAMKKVVAATAPVEKLNDLPHFKKILATLREASPHRKTGLCISHDWGNFQGKVEKFGFFMDPYAKDLWERLGFRNRRSVAMSREERNRHIERFLIAICNLHALGIIHCDIKPENLFLDETGDLFLGDFNLSVFLGEESNAGTYLYAHPQRLRSGLEVALPFWDTYSAGIVIAELFLAASPSKESMQKRRWSILATRHPHLILLKEYAEFLLRELNGSLSAFVSGLLYQNWTAEKALQSFRALVANGEDLNPVPGNEEDLLGSEFL